MNTHRWLPRPLGVHEEPDDARKWRCQGCGAEAEAPTEGECPASPLDLDAA